MARFSVAEAALDKDRAGCNKNNPDKLNCWTSRKKARNACGSSVRSTFREVSVHRGIEGGCVAAQLHLSSPRRRGPILRGFSIGHGVWIPGLASLARDDIVKS